MCNRHEWDNNKLCYTRSRLLLSQPGIPTYEARQKDYISWLLNSDNGQVILEKNISIEILKPRNSKWCTTT